MMSFHEVSCASVLWRTEVLDVSSLPDHSWVTLTSGYLPKHHMNLAVSHLNSQHVQRAACCFIKAQQSKVTH